MSTVNTPTLELRGLEVAYTVRGIDRQVLRGVSFSIAPGEAYGLVGESGCGKSVTVQSMMGLIPMPPGRITQGSARLRGQEILGQSRIDGREIRGAQIGMIFQDPMTALNPTMTIGDQIMESYLLHNNTSKAQARAKAIAMLEAVSIRDPERVMRAYPHEMSGGMGQRIMIAMMLIPDPQILIADEPTSALDVSVQRQVLDIMDGLVKERGMGLIFISHDLNLVSEFCDRVLIMYAGRIVEVCDADKLHQAKHPYTQGLLNSLPRLDQPKKHLEVLKRDDGWADGESVGGSR